MAELNTINQLLNEILTISESYKRVAEATGENFNIFSVLQMESDEVKTHSRFLAELLNPKGSHGQKDVFLKKFVERIGILDFETENAEVFVEFYIGEVTPTSGGRIDILIRNKGDVVMIENKIYANEQPNQLTRYKNKYPNGKLLFLTLDGKLSENKDIKVGEYQPISYQEFILNWLEKCKILVEKKPRLNEAITQYINLIKKLTGQNINTKMSEEIANRVIKDELSFEAFNNLVKASDEIRKQIFLQQLFPLINEVGQKHQLEIFLNQDQILNNKDKWDAFFWFKNSKAESLNLQICFAFNCVKGY